MSTEENWAANADRREHNRAVQALSDYKRLLGKQRYVRVDRQNLLGFFCKEKKLIRLVNVLSDLKVKGRIYETDKRSQISCYFE